MAMAKVKPESKALAKFSGELLLIGAGNIRVLPIANLLGEAIARTAHEESVSSLFD